VPDSRGSSSTASRQIEDEEEAELMGDVRRRNAEREESNLPETQKNLLRRTKLISNDTPEDKDRNLRIEYKRNLVHELTKHWHLMKGDSAPVVAIRIGRDGTIQAAKIRKSSGDETVDQAAIKAVYDLHLPPFDAMIKAKKLGFRVDFNRIVAKQQKEADKVLAGKRR
jgi:TonB family protein